jgi:hypothetical protein
MRRRSTGRRPLNTPRFADRNLSPAARRSILVRGVVVWLLCFGGEGVAGYTIGKPGSRVGATLFGVAGGSIVFFVLTWAVIIFAGVRKDRRVTDDNS